MHRNTTVTAKSTTECPGCSGKGKPSRSGLIGLYDCTRCGGIFGQCYLGESYGIVKPRFHPDPNSVPQEDYRYYDMVTLGSTMSRRHGWYDVRSGLILQVG